MPRLKSVGRVSSNPLESLPKSLRTEEEQPYSRLSTASPPPPLRMERGVNSIVCKQRGHLFDAKEGSLQYEETPSSIGEGRFLVFVLDVPVSEVLPRYTKTI